MSMEIVIVCSFDLKDKISRTKYFRSSLGLSLFKEPTTAKEKKTYGVDKRIPNDADTFAYKFFMENYRNLYAFGSIDRIKCYYDIESKSNTLNIYINGIKYDYNYTNKFFDSNELTKVIYNTVKHFENKTHNEDVTDKYSTEVIDEYNKKVDSIDAMLLDDGNEDKLTLNPGTVTANDVYKYLEKRKMLDVNEYTKKYKYKN